MWQRVEAKKKKKKINDKPKVETNKSFTTEQDPEQEYREKHNDGRKDQGTDTE